MGSANTTLRRGRRQHSREQPGTPYRVAAVILFYGKGDEAWKRAVGNELKKTSAYRGATPLLASYIYLAEPATESRESSSNSKNSI